MANAEPAEKRWVRYSGQWRLFNLRPSDPAWEGSVAWTPTDGPPHPDLSAADAAAGLREPAPRPSAMADLAASEPEQDQSAPAEDYSQAAGNKSRTTRPGTGRTGTTRRRRPAAGDES